MKLDERNLAIFEPNLDIFVKSIYETEELPAVEEILSPPALDEKDEILNQIQSVTYQTYPQSLNYYTCTTTWYSFSSRSTI